MFEVDLPIGKAAGYVSKSNRLSEGVVPGIRKISFSCEPSIHAVVAFETVIRHEIPHLLGEDLSLCQSRKTS